MQLNERVSESRQKLADLPVSTIEALSNCLLQQLGDPVSTLEKDALRSLESGDYDLAKRFCLSDPCNTYLAAISCIASAFRSPMVADSVLRDAARHTADVVKKRAESHIAEQFQKLLM